MYVLRTKIVSIWPWVSIKGPFPFPQFDQCTSKQISNYQNYGENISSLYYFLASNLDELITSQLTLGIFQKSHPHLFN